MEVTLGGIAGIIAAIVFALLVGFMAVPLLKLGRTIDSTTASIRELTDHTVPILDEAVTTVSQTNNQLERIDTITTSAAEVSENVSAMTSLFAATLGSPMIKVAAFTYGVRQVFAGKNRKKGR